MNGVGARSNHALRVLAGGVLLTAMLLQEARAQALAGSVTGAASGSSLSTVRMKAWGYGNNGEQAR